MPEFPLIDPIPTDKPITEVGTKIDTDLSQFSIRVSVENTDGVRVTSLELDPERTDDSSISAGVRTSMIQLAEYFARRQGRIT